MSPAADPLIRHRRLPVPMPGRDGWRIGCQCGWQGRASASLGRSAADTELNRLFVDHVPRDERCVYLLIDQRPGPMQEDEDGNEVQFGTGNFIMPAGLPCTLLGWWESDGMYYGRAQGFGLDDPVLELPIGEFRLENGKVFRAE